MNEVAKGSSYFKLKPKRGSYETFVEKNELLEKGEVAFVYLDIDDKCSGGAIVIGDGERHFCDLPFFICDSQDDIEDIYDDVFDLQANVTKIEYNLHRYINRLAILNVITAIGTISLFALHIFGIF